MTETENDPRTTDGDPACVYVETGLPILEAAGDDEPPYYLTAHESITIESEGGETVYIEVLKDADATAEDPER